MSQDLWYVCMYCKRAYKERERLIEHKKVNHLEQFLARKEARWRERNNLPPKIAVVHPRTSQDASQNENFDNNEATEEASAESMDQDVGNRSLGGQENVQGLDRAVQESQEDLDDETDTEMAQGSDNEDEETIDSEAETLDSETARAVTEESDGDDDHCPGPVSPISQAHSRSASPTSPANSRSASPTNSRSASPTSPANSRSGSPTSPAKSRPASRMSREQSRSESPISAEDPGPILDSSVPRENESTSSDDSDKTVLIKNATEFVQDQVQLSSTTTTIAGSVQPAVEDPSRQLPIKMRIKRSTKSTYSIDRSIKCPKCSRSFKNPIGLNVHIRSIHGEKKSGGRVKAKCSFCSRIFVSSSALNLHIRVHNKANLASVQGSQLAGNSGVGPTGTFGVEQTGTLGVEQTGTLGVEQTGTLGVEQTETLGVEQTGNLGVKSTGNLGMKPTRTLRVKSMATLLASQATKEDSNSASDTWFYQSTFGDGIRPTTAMKRAALARQRNSKRLKSEKYKCDYCDLEFISPTSLMVHRRSHKFNCNYCVKSFDTLEQAENHKRLHTFDKTLLCPYCPKTFAYPSPLSKHVAKMHPNGAVEPGPSTRSQTASAAQSPAARSPAALSQSPAARSPAHSSQSPAARSPAHSSQSPAAGPILRQVIPRRSKSVIKTKLAGKAASNKPEEKPSGKNLKKLPTTNIKCRFCPKICQTRQVLVAHESIHTGDRPYKCKYCPRGFVHKYEVVAHEGVHESGGQLFSCSMCKAGYGKKWILVSHIKSTHNVGEEKAKILANLKSAASGKATAVPVKKAEGKVSLRARPPPKVVQDPMETAITQILVDGLVQYECNHCSGRFSHKTDILAHVRYDHGLSPL